MDHVVVAFELIGDAPSTGGYISRIVASRHRATDEQTDHFQLLVESASPSDPSSLSASFDGFLRFVDGAPVVTHDGYNWKRFVRHALREQPSSGVKSFLARTIDISEWSTATFPKQRKDLASILKRLNIKLDPSLNGIDRDLVAASRLLPWVVPQTKKELLQSPAAETLNKVKTLPMTEVTIAIAVARLKRLPLHERLRCAWHILLGPGNVEICA